MLKTEMTLAEIEIEIGAVEARLDELRTKKDAIITAWVASLSEDKRMEHLRKILPAPLVDALSKQHRTEHDELLLAHALEDSQGIQAEIIAATTTPGDVAGLLRRKILSLPPEQLSWVFSRQYVEMLGLGADKIADVEAALEGLAGGETPIVKKFWFLPSLDGDVIEVPDEDIKAWKAGEGLAHPESGEEIPHPDRVLQFAWAAVGRG